MAVGKSADSAALRFILTVVAGLRGRLLRPRRRKSLIEVLEIELEAAFLVMKNPNQKIQHLFQTNSAKRGESLINFKL